MDDVIHRLKFDNGYYHERHAICGAAEHTRKGERLNFTIDPGDVTCEPCQPIDTGTVCPTRRRWWHRKPRRHVGQWRALDMGNCAYGRCMFCGQSVQQLRSRGGKPIGPWVDDVWIPCTHGSGGGPVPACMNCSHDRTARGLHS